MYCSSDQQKPNFLSTQFQHKTKYLYNLVHIILFWKNHQYFINIFFYYTSSPFVSLWKRYFWRFSFFSLNAFPSLCIIPTPGNMIRSNLNSHSLRIIYKCFSFCGHIVFETFLPFKSICFLGVKIHPQ